MSYGTHISKQGYDVVTGKQSKQQSVQDERFLPYMISGIAVPYLKGAGVSLQRYLEAASQLKKDVNKVYNCLYEASSLLEHLDTVDRYVIMCGEQHPLHKTILNMRNHIRHDLRDNLNHESNDGRVKREKELGIREGLLVDITFPEAGIVIGKTELSAVEIINFLQHAEQLFTQHIKEAQEKGLIKGIELT